MPGILSTNNPVVKVSGLRPSTLTTGLLVLLPTRKSKKDNRKERNILFIAMNHNLTILLVSRLTIDLWPQTGVL